MFDLIFKLLMLLTIAFLIGFERANSGKDVGFRSIAILMIGAFTFTYISVNNNKVVDYHVIAQIVTGISFVGAGLIFKDNEVHNLTTAITVWTSASIAVLIGLNFLKETIVISLIVLIILKSKKYEA